VAAPVAISSVSKPRRGHGIAAAVGTISPGALVLALALPLLFLHRSYQPTLSASGVDVSLSDVAALAVVVAAVGAGVRSGFAPLVAGRLVWATSAFFLLWIGVATAYGAARFGAYPLKTHAITMAKWDEYALLAPAVPLLLRKRRDLDAVLWSLAVWTAVAAAIGFLGFVGLPAPSKGATGHRQGSLLGWSDFAALAGAAVLAGAVVRRGALARVLIVSGVAGTILAGAVSAMLGLVTALGVLTLITIRSDRRRALSIVAIGTVIVAGAVMIRLTDLSAFQRFLHGSKTTTAETHIQTYSHRTLLAYIGGKIWLGQPVLGVGWQGSNDPWAFEPYLPAAHRRFPTEAPLAFPAPDRRYGIQLLYLQALADLGIVGLAALLALLAATFAVAARARQNAAGAIAALWILFVAWCWTAQGFVAGIPLEALTWLTVGLAATAAAWRDADG
jgi:hypothetical protein